MSGALLFIIPAYNEEAALPAVLDELQRELPGAEVLVVDDGSTDRTGAVAQSAGATVARLPFNSGIGGALRCGFRYADQHSYARAVQFDGDGQHDPAEVKVLLDALDGGADMVIGSRFAGRGDYRVGPIRRAAMSLLRTGVRFATGQRFTDTSSGFRAFGPDALALFARSYPSEYLESVEALVLACAEGLEVVEVPVVMRERADGQPSNRSLRLAYHYVRFGLVLVTLVVDRPRVRSERKASS